MSEEVQPAAEAAPAPVTIVETPQTTIDDTMGAVFDKLHPDTRVDRAETGKFESKAPKEPAESAESDPAEPVATDKTLDTPPVEAAKPSIPRPVSLSSDVDELWNGLSPAAQELWAKRESESNKKITELSQVAKSIDPIRQHLEPLQRAAQQKGLTADVALQRLLAAEEALTRDPAGAIKWLADSYGLNLSQFAQPPVDGSTPEGAHFNALQQEISQLKRQLGETTNRITSREQQEFQAREQTLAETVTKFSEGKDYWPEVEQEILDQIVAIRNRDPARVQADPGGVLKEAHDRAVKLNTAVQEKLNAASKAETEAKAKAEAKKKADEAKRLASLNVKSSTGSSPKASKGDIFGDMGEVYDRIHARG